MSNNNDANGAAFGFALVCAVVAAIAVAIYAVAAFIATALTIIALASWNKPLIVGRELVCTPLEARIFVGSGIAGAIGYPLFFAFCSLIFDFEITEGLIGHAILGGYAFTSLSVLAHLGDKFPNGLPDDEYRNVVTGPVIDHIPQPQPLPSPPPAPFKYASWEDDTPRTLTKEQRDKIVADFVVDYERFKAGGGSL